MDQLELRLESASCSEDAAVLRHFRDAIVGGTPWYLALLQAIRLWRSPKEEVNGRTYEYLIGNEAFDYLVLAERLCESADGLISESEKMRLFFSGEAPLELAPEEFKELLGTEKYRAYLNFHYGVTVEESLQLAVELEIQKEQRAHVYRSTAEETQEVYLRIYGAPLAELLTAFRAETGYAQSEQMTWHQFREFTYWLFKYRLKTCDPARVASDTRRALNQLEQLQRRSPDGSGRSRVTDIPLCAEPCA